MIACFGCVLKTSLGIARNALAGVSCITLKKAEQAANKLLARHSDFSEQELSIWPFPDTTELRQKLLSWEAGGDQESPIEQRVAYAKEYLSRLRNGIA